MLLTIDTRETIKKNVLASVKNSVVESLELGDYLFEIDGDKLVIERKTISDFSASITDGRHREQKSRLLANFPKTHIMYIVEGDFRNADESMVHQRVKSKTVFSSMINTMLRDDINVLHTSGTEETVLLLSYLADKLERDGLKFMNKSAITSHTDNLVATVHPCKRKNVDTLVALQMMISCVPGISTVAAKRITSRYKTMSDFVTAVKSVDTDKQMIFIQEMRGDTERKISKTAARNLISYLGI